MPVLSPSSPTEPTVFAFCKFCRPRIHQTLTALVRAPLRNSSLHTALPPPRLRSQKEQIAIAPLIKAAINCPSSAAAVRDPSTATRHHASIYTTENPTRFPPTHRSCKLSRET